MVVSATAGAAMVVPRAVAAIRPLRGKFMSVSLLGWARPFAQPSSLIMVRGGVPALETTNGKRLGQRCASRPIQTYHQTIPILHDAGCWRNLISSGGCHGYQLAARFRLSREDAEFHPRGGRAQHHPIGVQPSHPLAGKLDRRAAH